MKVTARLALALTLGLICLAVAGCSKSSHDAPMSGAPFAAPAAPPPQQQQQQDAVGPRRALLEVHATLDVEIDKLDRAQALADRVGSFVRAKGGYVADSRVGSDSGLTHLVLRVPPADLPALRGLLAGEGSILRESETATDVTDAIADLDARLRSARVEEARILKLLEEKSGSIADVLAAERALADVRQRIERLESDQRLAQGRVDLATVDVSLHHPAAASAEPSVAQRLDEAARDGVIGAKMVTIALLASALRAGPTLLLFSALLGAIVLAVRRARRLARTS